VQLAALFEQMTALLEYLNLEKWRGLAPSKIEVEGCPFSPAPCATPIHIRLEYISKKDLYTLTCPKNISAVKKGESKKVQVAEQLKDVISL